MIANTRQRGLPPLWRAFCACPATQLRARFPLIPIKPPGVAFSRAVLCLLWVAANPMPGESAWRLGGPSSLPGAQGGKAGIHTSLARSPETKAVGPVNATSFHRVDSPSNDDAARLLSHHLHDGRASFSLDLGDQASQQAYGHQALEWRLSIEGFCSDCRNAGVAGISGRTRKRGKEKALDLCHQRAEPPRDSRRPAECQS